MAGPTDAARGGARNLADAAASLLLGSACPGCGTPAARLCPDCEGRLAAAVPGAAPVRAGFTVLACAGYAGPWRGCLLAYKERSAWWLARPLGGTLAVGVAALCGSTARAGLTLVPVPSLPATVRRRGWDTTLGLARAAARDLADAGAPVRALPALRHVRLVRDQAGLGLAERAANLSGAFGARPAVGAGAAVVVDDLVTTGASLSEAVRALRAAGWRVAGAVTVAATPRRTDRAGPGS